MPHPETGVVFTWNDRQPDVDCIAERENKTTLESTLHC